MQTLDQMLDLFGIDKSPIVGLDIGSAGVKILALDKHEDKYTVLNYAVVPLEPGAVVEKNILKRDLVIQAIKDAVAQAAIITKRVAVALPSSTSITRVIELGAVLSDKEIGSEIELGADRYIPYPLHEVKLDYQVIGPSENNKELANILLVASKSENINNLNAILVEAGLKAAVVDIDVYALERAFELISNKLSAQAQDKVIAIFDIGATATTLSVIRNKEILYSREQAFGSQQLVDEVQNIYGLNYEEALLAIKYEDLPKDYETDVLNPFLATIGQQVNRFCQFFYSGGDYTSVDYIVLTGGCTSLPRIDVTVQNKMGVKTIVADPFADIILSPHIDKVAFNNCRNRLMACLGLAMRNCEGNGKY